MFLSQLQKFNYKRNQFPSFPEKVIEIWPKSDLKLAGTPTSHTDPTPED